MQEWVGLLTEALPRVHALAAEHETLRAGGSFCDLDGDFVARLLRLWHSSGLRGRLLCHCLTPQDFRAALCYIQSCRTGNYLSCSDECGSFVEHKEAR